MLMGSFQLIQLTVISDTRGLAYQTGARKRSTADALPICRLVIFKGQGVHGYCSALRDHEGQKFS
jgi:hypothetical protein